MSEKIEIKEEFSRAKDITEANLCLINKVRKECSVLMYFVESILGNTRYCSICKTKLEEFCMFANKGISKLGERK